MTTYTIYSNLSKIPKLAKGTLDTYNDTNRETNIQILPNYKHNSFANHNVFIHNHM